MQGRRVPGEQSEKQKTQFVLKCEVELHRQIEGAGECEVLLGRVGGGGGTVSR